MNSDVDDEFKSLFLPDLEVATGVFESDPSFNAFLNSTNLKVEGDLEIWGSTKLIPSPFGNFLPGFDLPLELLMPPMPSHYYTGLIPLEAMFVPRVGPPSPLFAPTLPVPAQSLFGRLSDPPLKGEADSQELIFQREPLEAASGAALARVLARALPSPHAPSQEPLADSLLLDLTPKEVEPVNLTDTTNKRVSVSFLGYLNGRFLAGDLGNSNIISCYRRNYIQASLLLSILGNEPQYPLQVNNLHVQRLKIGVFARSNILNDRIEVLVFEEHQLKKRKVGEVMGLAEGIGLASSVCEVPVPPSHKPEAYCFRKIQFRTATPNNGNLSFQNFYRLYFSLSAETAAGDVLLAEVVSNPVLVRGRNPSFYALRRDRLIPNKTAHTVESVSRAEPTPPKRTTSVLSIENILEDTPPVTTPSQGHGDKGDGPVASKEGRTAPTGSYTYIPITGAYHLPPLSVVYFPHMAHHPRQSDSVSRRTHEAARKSKRDPSYYFR